MVWTRWAPWLGWAGLALAWAAAASMESAGPDLRAAVEALERGQAPLADARLRAVATDHPLIADHADLLRMRLAVEQGDLKAARGFEALWSGRDSPLRPRFYAWLGDAHRDAGDEAAARAAWETASLETKGRAESAALARRIGESQLRSGHEAEAGEQLVRLWTRFAEQPDAEQVEEQLVALQRQGHAVLTASQYLKRGDTLYRRYRNEAALAAYERALALGLPKSDRSRAQHQRAETLFRLRRYPEAIEAFDALPGTEERAIQRARAVARTGRVREGALALEELAHNKRGSLAVRAQYLAGLLWDGLDDDRAGAHFEQVIRRAPASNSAGASRWWLGWHAYRDGRLDEAELHFADLASRERDPVAALRPRYWQARVRERRGDGDSARRFAEIAGEFPFSYYGWRALERLDAPLEARRSPVLEPGPRRLRPEQLERPRVLLEAGLHDEARDELARLFAQARGVEDRLALAELYADATEYDRAQQLVVNAYTETLARGPVPGYLELWWHAWPAPYTDALERAGGSGAPSPALVYSIMREESGYRPEVISISGARGLLQLMPDTARRVSASLGGTDFDPDSLFEPALNIRLGSAYLGQLLERFGGHTSAAIGSYNAGPEAVARWLGEPERPDDEWVEQIPYGQTRSYVKRVLRSLHVYRVLY